MANLRIKIWIESDEGWLMRIFHHAPKLTLHSSDWIEARDKRQLMQDIEKYIDEQRM